MKVEALALLVALGGCGKSDSEAYPKPMEQPSISADGNVKIPPGHETTYTFDGRAIKMEWTYVAIINVENKPALQFYAQGGPKHGMFSFAGEIPEHTPSLASLAGGSLIAYTGLISFGNAPEMATGTSMAIKITEVTPTYVAGTFEAQACKHAQTKCDRPWDIKNGTFRAFRSALSDDATFDRYVKKP